MSDPVHFTPVIDRHRTFEVTENERGLWIVHERHGLTEGVFRTRRDAVRFALFETGNPDSVVVLSGGDNGRRFVH
jgi:hypothetical protein